MPQVLPPQSYPSFGQMEQNTAIKERKTGRSYASYHVLSLTTFTTTSVYQTHAEHRFELLPARTLQISIEYYGDMICPTNTNKRLILQECEKGELVVLSVINFCVFPNRMRSQPSTVQHHRDPPTFYHVCYFHASWICFICKSILMGRR